MRVKSAAFINTVTLRGGAEKTLHTDTHQVLMVVHGQWLHVRDMRQADLACDPFGVPLANVKQVVFADAAHIFREAQKPAKAAAAVGAEPETEPVIDEELGFRKKP